VLLVVFTHHHEQSLEGNGSNILKDTGALQRVLWHCSDCLNVACSSSGKGVQGVVTILTIVPTLLGKPVAINVRQEGLLLSQEFVEPHLVTFLLDIAKVANVLQY